MKRKGQAIFLAIFLCLLFFGLFSKSSFAATVTCPTNYSFPTECNITQAYTSGFYSVKDLYVPYPEVDYACGSGLRGAYLFGCECRASVVTYYYRPPSSYCGLKVTAPCFSEIKNYEGWHCVDASQFTIGSLDTACASYCASLGKRTGMCRVENRTCWNDATNAGKCCPGLTCTFAKGYGNICKPQGFSVTPSPTRQPTVTPSPAVSNSCLNSGGVCCAANFGSFGGCVSGTRIINDTKAGGCNPSGTYPQTGWCCRTCVK